ncbi:MAG: diacylglycerol kinase [Halieaceae bacterium]|jgi:dihydrofolate reductase|nr:diacylglycerol kinase [Halieaceae bacterium]|tara:strand:- start:44 stop:574 length:531 start_codon:yes stop_codon:yes gene_type:complete
MSTKRSDNDVPVVLVLAAAENGVIGRGNALPWELPDDLMHFKRTTMGHPIVMGRKTFDSVGFPLPGRRNIVITRDRQWSHEGVLTCHELNEALERAFEQALIDGADAVMVVGGAEIYRLALPRADKVILTRVHDEVIGDVRFDLEVFADWRQVSSSRYEAVEGNSHAFSIEELEAP